MHIYDYIIVGGGLAGATVGYLLKKSGYKTLIVEKNGVEIKGKLCGGLMTSKSLDLLNNIFGEGLAENVNLTKVEKANVASNCIFEVSNIQLYTVSRRDLDSYVLREYINIGGEIRYNVKKIDFDFKENKIIMGSEVLSYGYLISADGTLSTVRKQVTNKTQSKNFALQMSIPNTSKNNIVYIEFDERIKGYNWIIPNVDCINYGTGDISENTQITESYRQFLERNDIISHESKGAFLPTGKDILLFQNNIFFIGDAAGLILPITGEGIYSAIYSAKSLYDSIIHKSKYQYEIRKLLKVIKQQLFLSRIIYNKGIRYFVFYIAEKNKLFKSFVTKFLKRYIL